MPSPPAKPARRRRPYHHGNLPAAAVREAKRLLTGRTKRDFTLAEVAAALGVSHQALYRHFSGKRGLLAALALEGHRTFYAQLVRRTEGLSGRGLLRATAQCYCDIARHDLAVFRAMFDPGLTTKKDFPDLREASDRNFAALGQILQRVGNQSPLPPAVVQAAVWSALHGMAVLEAEGWLSQRAGLTKAQLAADLPCATADALYDGLLQGQVESAG